MLPMIFSSLFPPPFILFCCPSSSFHWPRSCGYLPININPLLFIFCYHVLIARFPYISHSQRSAVPSPSSITHSVFLIFSFPLYITCDLLFSSVCYPLLPVVCYAPLSVTHYSSFIVFYLLSVACFVFDVC